VLDVISVCCCPFVVGLYNTITPVMYVDPSGHDPIIDTSVDPMQPYTNNTEHGFLQNIHENGSAADVANALKRHNTNGDRDDLLKIMENLPYYIPGTDLTIDGYYQMSQYRQRTALKKVNSYLDGKIRLDSLIEDVQKRGGTLSGITPVNAKGKYDAGGNDVYFVGRAMYSYRSSISGITLMSASLSGSDVITSILAALANGDAASAEWALMNLTSEMRNTFISDYTKGQGGINRNMPGNMYQILYDTWDRPPMYEDENGNLIYKPTGPENRYSNYSFGIFDALNWLIQTGGDINFVLQVRDLYNLHCLDAGGNFILDGNGNRIFDAWLASDIAAEKQAGIIEVFSIAKGMLDSAFKGRAVNMPNFYLGAVERHPETLIDMHGKAGIYDTVVSILGARGIGSSMIAGAYYGEDANDIEMARQVSVFIHEQRGKQLLWIPYFGIQPGQSVGDGLNDFFARVDFAGNETHGCAWGQRPLFDTILLQPGTFYDQTKQGNDGRDAYNIMNAIVFKINEWNREPSKSNRLGIQLEYDMGLVTSRADRNYTVDAAIKRQRLNDYFGAVTRLDAGTPIGMYSGGLNEQGYANPQLNANRHNTGNHRVQDSWLNYDYGNGWQYTEPRFPMPYNGNLIYDINNYLFNRGPRPVI